MAAQECGNPDMSCSVTAPQGLTLLLDSSAPTRDTPVSRQPKPRGDPGLESVVMWLKMDALATGAAPSAEQSLQSVVKWLDSVRVDVRWLT